jgi:acyl-CoA oxidase
MDGSAGTLCTLQFNCCAGTIATFVAKKPSAYLARVLEKLLTFEVSYVHLLSHVYIHGALMGVLEVNSV